jgi:rod shape-determining protein MreC
VNNRPLIRWVVLGLVLLALLNLPPSLAQGVKSLFREAVRPVQRAVDAVTGPLWASVTAVTRAPAVQRENDALRLERDRLLVQFSRLDAVVEENERLRDLLNLPSRDGARWMAAEVMHRTRDGWWQTARLDRGLAHGIGPNLAVVAPEGLVGKTVAASRNTADVLLLSDPSCRVSARLVRTGSFGIVSGRGPSWEGQVFCRMDFIHKDAAIQPGDEVVTSGLGGVFPPNIPIGVVDRVYTDVTGLYQYADVITRADLSALRFLFAVQPDGWEGGE